MPLKGVGGDQRGGVKAASVDLLPHLFSGSILTICYEILATMVIKGTEEEELLKDVRMHMNRAVTSIKYLNITFSLCLGCQS